MSTIPNCLGVSDPGIALITGASAGIGLEFATQLASQGFSLIVVARRKERLQEFADSMQQKYQAKVEILLADLATQEGTDSVVKRIQQEDRLDILVNNAGFGSKGDFGLANFVVQRNMLIVHNLVPVTLMQATLEKMRPRSRGAIINTSSLQSFSPAAGASMYAATKAFLRVFSESVAIELEGSGVRVQALCPGFTHTEFHEVGENKGMNIGKIPSFMWMNVAEVVRQSLAALLKGDAVVIPGGKNRFLKFLMTTWPFRLLAKKVLRNGTKNKQVDLAKQ